MGAWIETFTADTFGVVIGSHPEWVRGLKLLGHNCVTHQMESHPEWVRGLKLSLLML